MKSVCSKPFSFPWASSARLSTSFARHNVFHIPSAFFCISFYISVRRTLVFWITEYCSWLQSCSQPWAMLQPVVENRNVMMYRAWTCFRGLAKDYCLSAQNSMDSYVATGAKTKNSDLVTSSIWFWALQKSAQKSNMSGSATHFKTWQAETKKFMKPQREKHPLLASEFPICGYFCEGRRETRQQPRHHDHKTLGCNKKPLEAREKDLNNT